MSYDQWRLQTPEEYFGTEYADQEPCSHCGVKAEDHDELCECDCEESHGLEGAA